MKISKHFIQRWQERVGTEIPSPEQIEYMIVNAPFLQRGRDLYSARGHLCRVPALFWVWEKNIILKIDQKNQVAISVMTSDMGI